MTFVGPKELTLTVAASRLPAVPMSRSGRPALRES